jgi:hypothetical protein
MKLSFTSSTLGVGASVAIASVASGGTIDLTTAGASGTANSAFYQQIDPQSTGTGVIDPFIRLQAKDVEEGFNSNSGADDSPVFDETGKYGQNWNHVLTLSNLPVVNRSGTNYYQFLLDINQEKSDPLLLLTSVQIFQSAGADNRATKSPTFSLSSLGTKVFDMDIGSDGDTTVKLDYTLNPGSGAGDMFMYVPKSLFTGGPDVYFYSKFGDSTGAAGASNAGFEEWSTVQGAQAVPLPAAAYMGCSLLSGLGVLGMIRRRASQEA